MKIKAGKRPLVRITGDLDADLILHQHYAAKRLAKDRKTPQWELAAAAASNRTMLIGNSILFKAPR